VFHLLSRLQIDTLPLLLPGLATVLVGLAVVLGLSPVLVPPVLALVLVLAVPHGV
jgi:hypothetical protein